MKTPVPRTILYDADCPMCAWYTSKFVNLGVLRPEGRVPLTLAGPDCTCRIDPDRARHEIALVDHEKGETHYGLSSMFALMKKAFPRLGFIFDSRITKMLFYPLYQLITYNRRIMAGGDARPGGAAPDFNLFWRLVWILSAGMAGMGIYYGAGAQFSGWSDTTHFLLLATGGWLTSVVAASFGRIRQMDYIGHLATVFFMGALLILPVIALGAIIGISMPGITIMTWIGGLFLQYHMLESRRNVMGLPKFWTGIWMLGQVINAVILSIIITF